MTAVSRRTLARLADVLGPKFSPEQVKRVAPDLVEHIDRDPTVLRAEANRILAGDNETNDYTPEEEAYEAAIVDDERAITRRWLRTHLRLVGVPASLKLLLGDDPRLDNMLDDIHAAIVGGNLSILQNTKTPEQALQDVVLETIRATANALAAPTYAGGRVGAELKNAKRSAAAQKEYERIREFWNLESTQRLPTDSARYERARRKHSWSRSKVRRALAAKQPS